MTPGVDDRLERVLHNYGRPATSQFREEPPSDVQQGDVVVVHPGAGFAGAPTIALVLDRGDVEPDHAWVAACTPDVWLATESAAILATDETDLPYEIAVFSRIAAPIAIGQIRSRVGAIDDVVMEAILLLQIGREQDSVLTGISAPEWDERRDAIKTVASNLEALAEPLRRRAASEVREPDVQVALEALMPVLDPAVLVGDFAADAGEILDLFAAVGAGEVAVSHAALLELWDEAAGDYQQRRLIAEVIKRVVVGPATTTGVEQKGAPQVRHVRVRDARVMAVTERSAGREIVHLLTSASLLRAYGTLDEVDVGGKTVRVEPIVREAKHG